MLSRWDAEGGEEGREGMCKETWRWRALTRLCPPAGTLGYNESSFHMEMSQIGFSTHTLDVSPTSNFSPVCEVNELCLSVSPTFCSVLQDGILFGMVGAYDWDGGVLKEGTNGRIMPPREAFESEFPLELKNHAAYLGNHILYHWTQHSEDRYWCFSCVGEWLPRIVLNKSLDECCL